MLSCYGVQVEYFKSILCESSCLATGFKWNISSRFCVSLLVLLRGSSGIFQVDFV